MFSSIFGDGEEFPKLSIICQKIELNILLTLQHQIYVNVTYNVVDIALHTLLRRAGTAVAVFDGIFSTKRNIFVPVG